MTEFSFFRWTFPFRCSGFHFKLQLLKDDLQDENIICRFQIQILQIIIEQICLFCTI